MPLACHAAADGTADRGNEVTDTQAPDSPPASNDTWEGLLANLRRRFPNQKDGVLFCVHKLQQNPELTLRDFAAEAKLYGIPVAGRSIHSARLLLGLLKETPPAAAVTGLEPLPRQPRTRQRAPEVDDGGASIEAKVMDAVRQIQTAASSRSDDLRHAIREAIAILQRALDAAN
jgi:hypothetical protein